MDEKLFEDELVDILEFIGVFSEDNIYVDSVKSFKDSGITTNNGVIVELSDGSKFQLTIAKIE